MEIIKDIFLYNSSLFWSIQLLTFSILLHRREDFINSLKVAYITLKKDNLKIFGISKSKTLQDFVTTEKDVQKGLNRLPLNLARLIEEDIMSDEEVAAGKKANQMDHEMKSTEQQSIFS